MGEDWLSILRAIVQKKPLVVFQFENGEWLRLRESRRGPNEFTIARSHEATREVRPPTACLVFGGDDQRAESHFGIISSRSGVSTLESRVKVRRALHIRPSSKADLLQLITEQPHAGNLQRRLASDGSVIVLSSELSVHLVGELAAIEMNHGPMRAVSTALSDSDLEMAVVQKDALQTALRAFGLSPDDQAVSLNLVEGQESALAGIHIVEDSVIEHDARSIPGYELIGSDVTGYAVFENGPEQLEVYTANRRPLEKVFGVDLIYLNTTRQNIVMVQYKMLEPDYRENGGTDWVYRPDNNLDSEISRMENFNINHSPGQYEYRLNPQVFYLKFIKRNRTLKNAAISMPIDHFERLRRDPACRGPRGGFRISFESLAGRYLRQNAFLDLIRSGYIGAHAETTAYLRELVQAIVQGNRTVVAAVQSKQHDNRR